MDGVWLKAQVPYSGNLSQYCWESEVVKGIVGSLDHHVNLIAIQMIQWIKSPIIRLQLGHLEVWRNNFLHDPLREWALRIIVERVKDSPIIDLKLRRSLF